MFRLCVCVTVCRSCAGPCDPCCACKRQTVCEVTTETTVTASIPPPCSLPPPFSPLCPPYPFSSLLPTVSPPLNLTLAWGNYGLLKVWPIDNEEIITAFSLNLALGLFEIFWILTFKSICLEHQIVLISLHSCGCLKYSSVLPFIHICLLICFTVE